MIDELVAPEVQSDDPAWLTMPYIKRCFPDARLIQPRRYQGIDWKSRPFTSKLVYYGAVGPPDHVCTVTVRPTKRDKTVLHTRSFPAGRLRWSNLRTELVFNSIPWVHVEIGPGFRLQWNAGLIGRHASSKQWLLYWFGEKPR